jgi:hypothetical protein
MGLNAEKEEKKSLVNAREEESERLEKFRNKWKGGGKESKESRK